MGKRQQPGQDDPIDKWTPIERGDIYCSNACGGRCKRAEYDKAVRDAARVCKQLSQATGGDWEPEIWENLGWHWVVLLKFGRDQIIRVRMPYGRRSYDADLTDARSYPGIGMMASGAPARSAVGAVTKLMRALRAERARLGEAMVAVGALPPGVV